MIGSIRSPKSLSSICSILDDPICVDETTTKQSKIPFARVLVEIDIAKQVPKNIIVDEKMGKGLDDSVIVEWKPFYSQYCNRWGKSVMMCERICQ